LLKRSTISIFSTVLKIAIMCVLSFSIYAKEPKAELVWIESNDQTNSLYLAQYYAEKWNKIATPIYSTDKAITAPMLGMDKDQNRLLIWTEQKHDKFILMMATSSEDSDRLNWSNAKLFSDYGLENFGATIVRDLNGSMWVFWSASKGGTSDIYVSKKTGAAWSNPSKVNEMNEVPDSQPEARLMGDGNILVSWSTYNLVSNSYESTSKQLNYKLQEKNTSSVNDAVLKSQIPLPSFLPRLSVSAIHFPENKLFQSIRVSQ